MEEMMNEVVNEEVMPVEEEELEAENDISDSESEDGSIAGEVLVSGGLVLAGAAIGYGVTRWIVPGVKKAYGFIKDKIAEKKEERREKGASKKLDKVIGELEDEKEENSKEETTKEN